MSKRTGSAKPKKKPRRIGKLTDKEQSARFIAAAKAMGAESSEPFERAMDKLAPKKPRSN